MIPTSNSSATLTVCSGELLKSVPKKRVDILKEVFSMKHQSNRYSWLGWHESSPSKLGFAISWMYQVEVEFSGRKIDWWGACFVDSWSTYFVEHSDTGRFGFYRAFDSGVDCYADDIFKKAWFDHIGTTNPPALDIKIKSSVASV